MGSIFQISTSLLSGLGLFSTVFYVLPYNLSKEAGFQLRNKAVRE